MKRTTTLMAIFLSLAPFFKAQEPCSTGRYSTDVYTNVNVTSNIVYGQNASYTGANKILKLDFYEPVGDTATKRPLIIWAHGGSFLGGTKTDVDVADLSMAFAKKGYACASIDYRTGFFPIDSANAVKAVVRAVQDMKASIRFFYKDRADGINLYKIDTNNIFIGGSSAGAITALHVAYLDRTCEINDYVLPTDLAPLGGIDGNSGNPCYSSRVNGVVNLCGALAEYGWLEAGDLPVCSLHGTVDGTVKYNRGIVNPGVPLMYLDGSRMIHERAQAIGVQSNFYTFYGANHVPYAGTSAAAIAYMDTTVNFVRDYLIGRLGCSDTPLQAANTPAQTANLYPYTACSGNVAIDFCTGAGINDLDNVLEIKVYPNPTSSNLFIDWGKTTEMVIELIDFSGRKIVTQTVHSDSFVLERTSIQKGMYVLKLTDGFGNQITRNVIFQ